LGSHLSYNMSIATPRAFSNDTISNPDQMLKVIGIID